MKYLKIAILFIGITSFAQGKVGAADIEYIVTQMPEMEQVQAQLQLYADQLESDLNKKLGEYNELRDAYEKSKDNLGEAALKEKQAELIEKENDIQKYQQNGGRLMELKQQEFMRPLYSKIVTALNKVAKEQQYTYITQINQDMVYLDPNYDVTEAILEEMGITPTETTGEE